MSDSQSQSPLDDHEPHLTPVPKRRKRRKRRKRKKPPSHTELDKKKRKKRPSGSERRKRKKEKKLTAKRNTTATADRSSSSSQQDVQIRTNRFLRREGAVGKRSLLQDQLQHGHPASASLPLSQLTLLESASSATRAQAQMIRQKVVAYGAATFKKALRGWSGVPGKRLCYRLQKHLPVVLVNEFNTSKISTVTLEKLKDVQCWQPVVRDSAQTFTTERKLALCWGIKEYERTSATNASHTHRGLADRNRNAAANMRDLLSYWLLHHDRPPQFKWNQQRDNDNDDNNNNNNAEQTTTRNGRILGRPHTHTATSVPT